MRHPESLSPKTPEPYVLMSDPDTQRPKAPKVKNLPTQAKEQEKRKLVNDKKLLEQLRSKLSANLILSESDPRPESEPVLSPEPEPEPDPEPESVLSHTSDDAKPVTSTPLLFLPAKIKNAEVHFMIDSGATNNFLSHDLVRRLDLPMN